MKGESGFTRGRLVMALCGAGVYLTGKIREVFPPAESEEPKEWFGREDLRKLVEAYAAMPEYAERRAELERRLGLTEAPAQERLFPSVAPTAAEIEAHNAEVKRLASLPLDPRTHFFGGLGPIPEALKREALATADPPLEPSEEMVRRGKKAAATVARKKMQKGLPFAIVMKSKKESNCLSCTRPIGLGDMVCWQQGKGAWHKACTPAEVLELAKQGQQIAQNPRPAVQPMLLSAPRKGGGTRSDGDFETRLAKLRAQAQQLTADEAAAKKRA